MPLSVQPKPDHVEVRAYTGSKNWLRHAQPGALAPVVFERYVPA